MTTTEKTKSKARDRHKSPRAQMQAEKTLPEAPAEQQEEVLWREQAAFHVTLNHLSDPAGTTFWQTHAYHEESGDEYVQPDVLDQAVISWMRQRAGIPADELQTPAASAEMPAEAPRVTIGLAVGALEVIELPAERQAGGEEIGVQVGAQVTFDLTGPLAYIATAELKPYTIQVVALDLQSDKSALLASRRRNLQPELLSYAETLALDLPAVGSYQLIANVVLSEHDLAAVACGPVLNVVP